MKKERLRSLLILATITIFCLTFSSCSSTKNNEFSAESDGIKVVAEPQENENGTYFKLTITANEKVSYICPDSSLKLIDSSGKEVPATLSGVDKIFDISVNELSGCKLVIDGELEAHESVQWHVLYNEPLTEKTAVYKNGSTELRIKDAVVQKNAPSQLVANGTVKTDYYTPERIYKLVYYEKPYTEYCEIDQNGNFTINATLENSKDGKISFEKIVGKKSVNIEISF